MYLLVRLKTLKTSFLFFISAFIFINVFMGISCRLHAQELFDMNRSLRAYGMGNAYTAVVRNSDAVLYNPAGIARIQGFNWLILDATAGASGQKAIEDIGNMQGGDNFSESLREIYGDHVWVGAGAKSFITSPHFALGAYDSADVGLAVNNPAIPEVEVNAINDFAYVLGFAGQVTDNFHMGMTLKRIARTGSRTTLGSSYVGKLGETDIESEILNKGIGYGMDLGMNFIGLNSGPIRPAFSFVWRNIGTTKFRVDSGTTPPSEEEEMLFGGAVEIDGGLIAITPSFDYRYLNRHDVQSTKKINLGLELALPLISLRGGFHQGYYTMGFGLSLGPLHLDAATWGVELGDYAGQLEDRRYAIQLSIEIGFDMALNFVGWNKSGSARQRGLKMRR